MSTSTCDSDHEVRPPALGATRLPGPRLHSHHGEAVELVGAAVELRPQLGADTLHAAAALAQSTIDLVRDIVGHDLSPYRTLFSEAAHFGGLLAVAEEHQAHTAPGRVAPHAAELLACVGAEFVETDQLAEQLCRWLLESGYFLVRTGTPTEPLVESLRADLARLLAAVVAAEQSAPQPAARLPRQGGPARSRAAEAATGG